MHEINIINQIISQVDLAIRTLLPPEERTSKRPIPGKELVKNH